MTRFGQIRTITAELARRAGLTFRAVRSRPGALSQIVGMLLIIVLALPIAAFLVLLTLAAIVFLGILAGLSVLRTRLRGMLPRNDGRANVRVIRRPE